MAQIEPSHLLVSVVVHHKRGRHTKARPECFLQTPGPASASGSRSSSFVAHMVVGGFMLFCYSVSVSNCETLILGPWTVETGEFSMEIAKTFGFSRGSISAG